MISDEEYEMMYPEEIRRISKTLLDGFIFEQKGQREISLREYKKLDYYWEGFQNIFWDAIAGDWRPYEEPINADPTLNLADEDIGKVINIYRAYGEAIIAGLSASLPSARFAPDDADNPDDISTAKAYSKIADLVYIHNNATLLFTKALFILYNQAFVACYNYHDEDEKYGIHEEEKEIETEVPINVSLCPDCLGDLSGIPTETNDLGDGNPFESAMCPDCGTSVIPDIEEVMTHAIIPTTEQTIKGRELLEIYGPVNVKVPFYVSSLKQSPYLILQTEHHVSFLKSMYPWIRDKIKSAKVSNSYERFIREPAQVYSDDTADIVTLYRCWLRPWAYESITDEELRREFSERFPEGCYISFVEDVFAEIHGENIDDHWTITESPVSQYIHAAPMGRIVIDVQDLTNDIYNLTERTIFYGIPMMFVEATAIEWDKLKKKRAEPGELIPIKVPPGLNASGMFHTIKAATLSQEVEAFGNRLEQAGQFLLGAFPSIYGGTLQGGSKTYKEYESSRNQALQRLGLTWKTLNIWWKDLTTKSAKEFARELMYDEKYVKRTGDSFINVWIKRAELQGKIGEVEAETSDQFPVSSAQKRGLLLELMQFNNEYVNQALYHPENIGLLARLLGFNELFIPGDDQRNKQLYEILEMQKSVPMMAMDPMGNPMLGPDGMPAMQSSSPIEPYDNDAIHAETVTAFLTGETGQYLKVNNEAGYQNILLHLQEHQMRLAAAMQMQQQQQAQLEGGDKAPKENVNVG